MEQHREGWRLFELSFKDLCQLYDIVRCCTSLDKDNSGLELKLNWLDAASATDHVRFLRHSERLE